MLFPPAHQYGPWLAAPEKAADQGQADKKDDEQDRNRPSKVVNDDALMSNGGEHQSAAHQSLALPLDPCHPQARVLALPPL